MFGERVYFNVAMKLLGGMDEKGFSKYCKDRKIATGDDNDGKGVYASLYDFSLAYDDYLIPQAKQQHGDNWQLIFLNSPSSFTKQYRIANSNLSEYASVGNESIPYAPKVSTTFSSDEVIEVIEKMCKAGCFEIPQQHIKNWVLNAFNFPDEPMQQEGILTKLKVSMNGVELAEFLKKLISVEFITAVAKDDKSKLYAWVKCHMDIEINSDTLKTNMNRRSVGRRGKFSFEFRKQEYKLDFTVTKKR